jgi:hypothetical protein
MNALRHGHYSAESISIRAELVRTLRVSIDANRQAES